MSDLIELCHLNFVPLKNIVYFLLELSFIRFFVVFEDFWLNELKYLLTVQTQSGQSGPADSLQGVDLLTVLF